MILLPYARQLPSGSRRQRRIINTALADSEISVAYHARMIYRKLFLFLLSSFERLCDSVIAALL